MMRPANDLPDIMLCTQPIDFRKDIAGLAAMVEDSQESSLLRKTVRVHQSTVGQSQAPVLGAQRLE